MLVPLIGPSCAGKSLLLRNLRTARPELQPLESVTTRSRRESDTLPGEYLFVDEAKFDAMEAQGEFLWVVHPHNLPYRYGTRRSAVEYALRRGLFAPILIPEAVAMLYEFAAAQGLRDGVRPIFLSISDTNELRRRFKERGDADMAEVERRVLNAEHESRAARALGGLHEIDATQAPEKVLKDALAHVRLFEE